MHCGQNNIPTIFYLKEATPREEKTKLGETR